MSEIATVLLKGNEIYLGREEAYFKKEEDPIVSNIKREQFQLKLMNEIMLEEGNYDLYYHIIENFGLNGEI